MARHGIVTLLTDFGTRDPYVAAMKGALLRQLPAARIVDICHDIAPHDILQASFVLAQAAPEFPPGTVHVVVVDPGVGTEREIIAAQFGDQVYLFPDNGVITMVMRAQPLRSMALVHDHKYFRPGGETSRTFHGRDIFAPVAGHLVGGLDLAKLGPVPEAYTLVDLAEPRHDDHAIVGQVIYIDRFGNLISNITKRDAAQRWRTPSRLTATCAGRNVGHLLSTYGRAGRGDLLALVNSMGFVEIAANSARACDVLGVGIGAEIRLTRESAEHHETPQGRRPVT